MGSKAGNILKTVAPIAAGFIPGVGPLAGAALGAGLGATGGGGLTGALTGGLSGYGGAGIGNSLASGGLKAIGSGISNFVSNPIGSIGSAIGSVGNSLSNVFGGTGGAVSNAAVGAIPAGSMINSSSGGLAGLFGGGGSLGGLGTLANVYSGIQGNKAYKNMANAQLAANDKALALQAQQYDQTQANLNPFRTAGTSASTRLSDLMGISPNTGAEGYGSLSKPFAPGDLTQDPGYQFRLAQGTKAMNQSLGARGSLFSGAALKAAQDFGQGLADQTYNDAWQRYNTDQGNLYNRLNTQASAGQNAAANLGASGAQYANQASQLFGNAGDITANRIQGQSNATNQSLANIIGSGVGGQSPSMGGQTPIYDQYGRIVGYRQGGGFY